MAFDDADDDDGMVLKINDGILKGDTIGIYLNPHKE